MPTSQYVEVTLPNGAIVTKKATRNFTHAIVADQEAISWHVDENNAHRALHRKAASRTFDGVLRIERTRVAS